MKVELFTNDLPVVDFTLDLKNRTITNMHIVNSLMANIYLGNNSEDLTFVKFESLIKKYMGGNFTMEEYIEHIKKHGFYTPYKRNLRIRIV